MNERREGMKKKNKENLILIFESLLNYSE